MSSSQSATEIFSSFASRLFSEEKLATDFSLTPETIEKFNFHLNKYFSQIEATDTRNLGNNEQKAELITIMRYNLPKILEWGVTRIYVDSALLNKISEACNDIRIHAHAKINGVKVINQHGIEVSL